MSIDHRTAMQLRRQIYAGGAATRADLERLIDLGRATAGEASPDFAELIADVAQDVLLNAVDPPKYIQPADAAWLAARLARDGGLASQAEYDMLIRVIRHAVFVPASLSAFAVGEIERRIVSAAAVDPAAPIAQDDLEALRTAVFAATAGSSLHVTRDSAEALFRIADMRADASDPAFEEFFAKAIGNYLMGIAFRWTLSAEKARKADDWLDAPAPAFGDFVSAMFDFDRIRKAEINVDALQNAADEKALASAARIDPEEADWLLLRLDRDGRISAAEKRLLSFLKQEATTVAPALAALMEKAA